MAIRIRNIKDGTEYEGFNLEYILDEGVEVGEVYLDETLIYQADDIFTEKQLKQDFKYNFTLDTISDDIVGLGLDQIDYMIDGVASGLYTVGAEYMTTRGTEFIGDYHIHPDGVVCQGKFHSIEASEKSYQRSILELMDDEDRISVQDKGVTHIIDYTVDSDEYNWISTGRNPIELTDEELLEEQRNQENIKRFGIQEDIPGTSIDDITIDPDELKQRY